MKKNKLIKVIIALITLCIFAIILAVGIPLYNSYKFENYDKEELIKYLTGIEEEGKRQEEIEKALKNGWITEKDLKNAN